MACSVKGCPFPEVHWLKDINETIPVCSQHGEFYHEEAGYFDANIRLSLLSHSGSASSLRAAIQDSLHPNIGFRLRLPSRRTGRLNIADWANRRAERREQERIRERAYLSRIAYREQREAERIESKRRRLVFYQRLHAESKWGKYADRLAQAREGDSIFLPHSEPQIFARQLRNGLNGHKVVMNIRRSVKPSDGGVVLTHAGAW